MVHAGKCRRAEVKKWPELKQKTDLHSENVVFRADESRWGFLVGSAPEWRSYNDRDTNSNCGTTLNTSQNCVCICSRFSLQTWQRRATCYRADRASELLKGWIAEGEKDASCQFHVFGTGFSPYSFSPAFCTCEVHLRFEIKFIGLPYLAWWTSAVLNPPYSPDMIFSSCYLFTSRTATQLIEILTLRGTGRRFPKARNQQHWQKNAQHWWILQLGLELLCFSSGVAPKLLLMPSSEPNIVQESNPLRFTQANAHRVRWNFQSRKMETNIRMYYEIVTALNSL